MRRMDRRFPRRKFRPLGAAGASALGLSRRRRDALEIEAAWRRVCGGRLAERCRVLGVRRGVLELELADDAWRGTLQEIAPRLGGSVARDCPRAGIRAVRLYGPDGGPCGPPAELGEPLEPPAPKRPAPLSTPRDRVAPPDDDPVRLQRLMQRYLERASDASGDDEA